MFKVSNKIRIISTHIGNAVGALEKGFAALGFGSRSIESSSAIGELGIPIEMKRAAKSPQPLPNEIVETEWGHFDVNTGRPVDSNSFDQSKKTR